MQIDPWPRLDRPTWAQFAGAIRSFDRSEVGGRARLRFGALMVLLLAINGLNVVNSYVGRDFMTAIEQRSASAFVRQALLYAAVFAASTLAAVIYRVTEERLALLWREWLTRRLVDRYLERGSYYRLKERGEVENPDQRIADDVRSVTTTTLSFVLMLLNGTLTILSFSGVLWSIHPLLFAVALGYAGLGTLFTFALGRPLAGLGYRQSDAEASLRADLVHVRENAESIVLTGRERRLAARLGRRLETLVANTRRMIAVNRNLGFFTTGYNYLIQLVPALIVAPLFFRGEVQFGVIPQSAMAFSHLMGAFSLIVTQFQSISSYAVALVRLGALDEAAVRANAPNTARIEFVEAQAELGWERLSLRSPRDGRLLIRDLSARVVPGTRLLVTGPDPTALLALFRATAGIWESGEGRIVRPSPEQLMFLPERPYLPPGSLREVLVRTGREAEVGDERIVAVLRALEVERVLERTGGLGEERDWDDILSLGEHQLMLVARLVLAAPRFAVLHQIGTTLSPNQVARSLELCADAGITCIGVGGNGASPGQHDALLELAADGSWSWRSLA
jgi:putative ATP-binding cassette transporter